VKPIVVVDDEEMIRSLIARILTEEGFQTLEAADGRAGLEIIERLGSHVSLVVSDVVMPRLNGVALLEHLSVSHPGVPVILISGYGEHELAGQGLKMPCGILRKPFMPEALVAEVRRCLTVPA
jgi:DNA-binding NtrC family response regulator